MQHIKHAVISCAGVGSRLGLNIPKCLVEINNRKLIDYQLDLLKNIKDVRIVVGFKELEVIAHVRKIRSDVTFVRNPNYATTSNSYSLYLASKDLQNPFITIDGDMIIHRADFRKFIVEAASSKENIICVTPAKTTEAVFAKLDSDKKITEFSRKSVSAYEWCGIAYLYDLTISPSAGFVYKQFVSKLPMKSFEIDCYEIDTPEDLDLASSEANRLFAK